MQGISNDFGEENENVGKGKDSGSNQNGNRSNGKSTTPSTPPPLNSRKAASQNEQPKSIYTAIFGKAFERTLSSSNKSTATSSSNVPSIPRTPSSSDLRPTPTIVSGGRTSLPASPSISTHASITQARSPFSSPHSHNPSSPSTQLGGNLIGTSTSAKLSLKASSPQLGSPSRRVLGGPTDDWDPHNDPTREQRLKEHKDAFAKPLVPIHHQSPSRRNSNFNNHFQSPSPSKKRKVAGSSDHPSSPTVGSRNDTSSFTHASPSRRSRIFSAGVGLRPSPSSSPSSSRQRFASSNGIGSSPSVLPNGHPASSLAQGLGIARSTASNTSLTPSRTRHSSFRDHISSSPHSRRISEGGGYDRMQLDYDQSTDGDQDQVERDRVASVLAGLHGRSPSSANNSPLRNFSDLRSSPGQARESNSRGSNSRIQGGGPSWHQSNDDEGRQNDGISRVSLRKTLSGPVILNGERERESRERSYQSPQGSPLLDRSRRQSGQLSRPTTPRFDSSNSSVPDDGEAAETMLLFAGSPSQPSNKGKSRSTFDGIPHDDLRSPSSSQKQNHDHNVLPSSSQESNSSLGGLSDLNLSNPNSQSGSSSSTSNPPSTPPASKVSLPTTSNQDQDSFSSQNFDNQPRTPPSKHSEGPPKTPGSNVSTLDEFVRVSPSPQPRSIASFGGTTPQLGNLLSTPTSASKSRNSGRILDFDSINGDSDRHQQLINGSPSLHGTPKKRMRAISREEAKISGR